MRCYEGSRGIVQQCQYCFRWFKNYRGLRVHQAKCKFKEFKETMDQIKKQVVSIHTVTPYDKTIDSKTRSIRIG